MKIVEEFKAFAVKGNVVDMAVGITIGVAFTKIVNSLVNDVMMPPLGMLLGNVEFKDLAVVLKPAELNEQGMVVQPEVAVRYGAFCNAVIEWILIAIALYLVVRTMNRLIRSRETAEAA